MKNLLVALFIVGFTQLFAQQFYTLSGTVKDSSTGESLPNAYVLLLKNNQVQTGASSNLNGTFSLSDLAPNTPYTLKVSFIGYKVLQRSITLTGDVNVGNLWLKADPQLLEAAEVRANLSRVIINGDTVAFNADAYKVNEDASTQDLLTKMPGVVVENGKINVQGEEVKRVLVDGKEFFSNDPNVALQSLPAEVVSQIKVFDDQSDQSKFTGFDDGNTVKTIDIITKSDKNNGQFGKVYGGYGTNGRYLAGGNMNFFNGNQRWTILGLTNNINVQNFSTQDIVGAIGSSNGTQRRRGRRNSGSGASADASDFLVSSQGGISATNAFGLNYIDEWGKKVKVSGSYFFNESNNTNDQFFTRNYLSDVQNGLLYQERDLSSSNNQNHRFNLRAEYTIDERNSILFRPSFSTQLYTGSSFTDAANLLQNNQVQSSNSGSFNTELSGLTYGTSLLYRHKFEKTGRTFSVQTNTNGTTQQGENTLLAANFFNDNDSLYAVNQQAKLNSYSRSYSAEVTYTEPIGDGNMLLFKYEPEVQLSEANQRTNAFDSLSDAYTDLQNTLSSDFTSQYQTQEAGVAFMKRSKTKNLMVELKGQYAVLSADQLLPETEKVNRTFINLLPHARYRISFKDKSNLSVFYRTRTEAPSFNQLQSVVDNSNLLQVSVGNPDLVQQFTHQFGSRYRATYKEGTHSLFLGIFGSATQDYIANATFIAQSDTLITTDYTLPTGAQLSKPVNVNGFVNVNSFASYGFPVKALKSNLNLSANLGYRSAPGLINNQQNFSNTITSGLGAVLGSNISKDLDFTLSYRGAYNQVNSTLQVSMDNSYYQHTAGLRFNWQFGKGFVINTDVNQTMYSGLADNLTQNFTLWNASFGYKFLKEDRGELKLSVFDILSQNNSVSRTVTETYVEDQQTTVLQQYFMLSFTYTFRNFGKAAKGNGNEENDTDDLPPPGLKRPDNLPPKF